MKTALASGAVVLDSPLRSAVALAVAAGDDHSAASGGRAGAASGMPAHLRGNRLIFDCVGGLNTPNTSSLGIPTDTSIVTNIRENEPLA